MGRCVRGLTTAALPKRAYDSISNVSALWRSAPGAVQHPPDEDLARRHRALAQELAGADLVFTSPQDDHIDRAAYFERCFPTADRFRSQELLRVAAATGEDVFVMYEYELRTGARLRNAELITVRNGQIVEVQVFFGGAVTAS